MSKVATAVTVLQLLGWGDKPGTPPTTEVRAAMRGALTRSENCRQRRVVLELQRLAGSPAAAAGLLSKTFAAADAHPAVATQTKGPDPICHDFLAGQRQIADPLGPALLLGTSRWTTADAARFAEALGAGRYGAALTAHVLHLMRLPKLRSREATPFDFTADLDWGAGAAIGCLHPAYKAGWGGSLNGDFLAGQIAIVEAGSRTAAVAAVFRPSTQPPRDDPGVTRAPEAIEDVMAAFGHGLGRGCGSAP